MADAFNPLADLADIIEPEFSSGLPAPGWWILTLLIIILLVSACWFFYRRWRFLAARRQAQDLFNHIDLQAADAPATINQLLKRLVLHYHPEQQKILSASTEQWQQFLQQQLPDTPLPTLSELLYRPEPATASLQQFHHFAARWLKQFNGRSLRTAPIQKTGGSHA